MYYPKNGTDLKEQQIKMKNSTDCSQNTQGF